MRRRLRLAIGYALLGVLALVVIVALLAGFRLLGTASGAGRLLSWAEPSLPGTLDYERIDGALLRTLTIEGFEWRQADLRVDVERLSIAVDLWPLLAKGLVEVRSLRTDGVRITLPPGKEEPARALPTAIVIPALPEIVLPIGVVIRDAVVSALEIQPPAATGEEPAGQRIDRIELVATAFRSDIDIERLTIAAPAWGVELQGDAALRPSMPLNLRVAWRFRYGEAAGDRAAGALTLSGDRRTYAIDHALSAPYAVRTRGTIAPGEDDTSVDISSRIEPATATLAGRQIATRGATLGISGTRGRGALSSRAALMYRKPVRSTCASTRAAICRRHASPTRS